MDLSKTSDELETLVVKWNRLASRVIISYIEICKVSPAATLGHFCSIQLQIEVRLQQQLECHKAQHR